MEQEPVSRREIDQLLSIGEATSKQREAALDERWDAHRREHGAESNERQIVDAARGAAHDERWSAHRREHDTMLVAAGDALTAVDNALTAAQLAHQREHTATEAALDKAERATEKRFESVNEFRGQLADLISRLASKEAFETLNKDVNRRFDEQRVNSDQRFETLRASNDKRFDELRTSVTNIEKLDVKTEGKGIGQATVVGYIIGGVGFLTAVIALYNTLPAR